MAIRVKDTKAQQHSYERGHTVSVKDGHLYVYDSTSRVLAIFAPNTWMRAEEIEQK